MIFCYYTVLFYLHSVIEWVGEIFTCLFSLGKYLTHRLGRIILGRGIG